VLRTFHTCILFTVTSRWCTELQPACQASTAVCERVIATQRNAYSPHLTIHPSLPCCARAQSSLYVVKGIIILDNDGERLLAQVMR
jgi:hypothetical protein